MGGQQHGALARPLGHDLAEPEALLGVQARGGFVQDQEIRVSQERLGQCDPPTHPPGERLDLAIHHAFEPDQRQHATNLLVAREDRSVISFRIAM